MNDSILKLLAPTADADDLFELPSDAPFDDAQREWLSGLLTGIRAMAKAASAPEDEPGTPVTVLYGSQSGNCEVLARDLRKFSATQGFDATVAELDEFEFQTLGEQAHVLIVCSTFGEGEPPDNARRFYDALMADDAAPLPATLNFAVCGLGDSSYADFNKCAIDVHNRLVELGATPCREVLECDVAFEDDYEQWKGAVFETAPFREAAGAATVVANDDELTPAYDKNRPFLANVVEVRNLSGEGSAKTVNHVAISLAGGGEDMHYDVGDALGVWPLNCPEEVAALLAAAGLTGGEVVQHKSGSAPVRALLQTRLDIQTVNAKALATWGVDAAPDDGQVIDVLLQQSPDMDAQTLVDGLRPLQPRLYSIASSPRAHPGEVHLTVGEVHYDLFDSARKGVASTWLGQRLPVGATVGVYVQPSLHFHITDDDTAPVIMIGPGTGIAPFRAFLEERAERKATGQNWLFFGDQHEAHDFLYRDEVLAWQESGVLDELSLAWSRDSETKVYVQTLMQARGAELFDWLERGAVIYVCGDASRMASDVDTALRSIIAQHGGLAEVEAYMDRLVDEHRYQRDVY
ncbi:MAG: sulfite reductase flavoprotein subunit alpha [Pseudomonadota bacterium]